MNIESSGISFRENLIKYLVLVAILATLANVPIFYFLNKPFSYFLMVYIAAYSLILILSIKKKLSHTSHVNMTLVVFFIHMLSIPVMNGNNTMVIAWIALYPIVAFTVKSATQALYFSLSFLLSYCLLFSFSLLDESYSLINISIIGMINLVLSTILYSILKVLESKEKALNELNYLLEKKVQEKTKKLQDLNNNLENEILQQVNNIREKDKYIISQSKLAAMGEMIGNIAHQWRQPLNALGLIQQKMQLFHERGALDDEKFISNINQSMKHIESMSETIDDFRNFINPNKEKEKFSIEDTINKAFSMVKSSFKDNNIGFTLVVIDDGLMLDGYQNELSQVVLNLLNNAKDVLMAKGNDDAHVVINIQKDNNAIIIRCCDNGDGVSSEVLPRIFEPYFTTKGTKGTGLGLYMSKMIVEENMNGNLSVSNTDDGACFTMRFIS